MRRPSTETKVAENDGPSCLAKTAQQVPVGGSDVRHPFAFSLHDQPYRDTLHTTGRQTGTHLFPEQLRDIISVQSIQDAACFLSPHQALVDVSRMGQGLGDRRSGDLMKHEAVDRYLRLEQFA